jgi:hypothetical protein
MFLVARNIPIEVINRLPMADEIEFHVVYALSEECVLIDKPK